MNYFGHVPETPGEERITFAWELVSYWAQKIDNTCLKSSGFLCACRIFNENQNTDLNRKSHTQRIFPRRLYILAKRLLILRAPTHQQIPERSSVALISDPISYTWYTYPQFPWHPPSPSTWYGMPILCLVYSKEFCPANNFVRQSYGKTTIAPHLVSL